MQIYAPAVILRDLAQQQLSDLIMICSPLKTNLSAALKEGFFHQLPLADSAYLKQISAHSQMNP